MPSPSSRPQPTGSQTQATGQKGQTRFFSPREGSQGLGQKAGPGTILNHHLLNSLTLDNLSLRSRHPPSTERGGTPCLAPSF